jgi:succinate dehydrogenase flavin-adding protein (antitoxin of CptAB toxin-antitoxin module)
MFSVARIRYFGASIARLGHARCLATSDNLPNLSPQQLEKIGKSDHKLRNQHTILESTLSAEDRDIARRKRMIYRSKQRGWLEADILLGSWAVENIPHLSSAELDEYELLLAEETIDIYNYVSKKDPLPPHLQDLPLMKRMQEYAYTKSIKSPEDYESVKREANLT